jgi:hypothetical protein
MTKTWEEKLAAIQALSPSGAALRMRQPGDWHVVTSISVVEEVIYLRPPTQRAPSPQAAVEEAWKSYTSDVIVCIRGKNGVQTYHRWNGHMWALIKLSALRSDAPTG